MDTQTERLPALITRAAKALAEATTSAEILDAKDAAQVAFATAKAQATFLKKKKAHDEVISACQRVMADALFIESQAQCRLADEYDAAQERGEIRSKPDLSDEPWLAEGISRRTWFNRKRSCTITNSPRASAKDIGLDTGDVCRARKVRDAEKIKPGIVRDTLEAALKAGKDPTHAGVARAVNEIATRSRKKRESKRGRVTPTLDKAREIVRDKLDANEPISPHKLQAEHGVSHVTFDMAITAELARKEALEEKSALDPSWMSKTAQEKLEAAIRQHKRQLDVDFEQRVQAEVQSRIEATILPHYNEKYDLYLSVIKARKGILDRASYRKILAALHPDRQLDPALKKKAEDAFNLFTKIEKLVLDEKESPTGDVPLPKTYADLMARRKTTGKRGNGAVRQRG
jgi:hypothetical protein